jgi:isopenicillin N synthase-like dioxygenase
MKTKTRTNANDPGSFNNDFRGPNTQNFNASEGIDILESYAVEYDPRMDSWVTNPSDVPAEAAHHCAPGGHPWEYTNNLPDFKNAMASYFRECLNLARALTRAFALSLDLVGDCFDDKVKFPEASLTLNYFPPLEIEHPMQGTQKFPRTSVHRAAH